MSALWLPILLSAVIVFFLSSIIHMLSPWHKNDYPAVPREDEVIAALRPLAIPPGDYIVPRPPTRNAMRDPAFLDRVSKGPVLILTVMRNEIAPIGRKLGMWFLYLVAVSSGAAFIASRAVPLGALADRVRVFTGVTAFVGYAAALWQMSIWYERALTTTLKATVDGLIYATVTAFVFAWLWPR